jgi:class 3 adenylate cyclase
MNESNFWSTCERRSIGENVAVAIDPAVAALARAHDQELANDLDAGRASLNEARAAGLDAAHERIARTIEARLSIRSGVAANIKQGSAALEALLTEVPEDERPTRGRALHTLGVAAIREDRLEDAERFLAQALRAIDTEPCRTWVLDSFAQTLIGTGAWEEARRLLLAMSDRRRALGDTLGIAITAGHLGRMLLSLERADEAIAVVEEAIAGTDGKLPDLSALRLATLHLDATLDLGRDAEASVARVQALVDRADARHYLVAYALLSLARAAKDDRERAAAMFERAYNIFTLPPHKAWARYCAARVLPNTTLEDVDGDAVNEAVIFNRLLLAERAHEKGDIASRRYALERAYTALRRANNPAWREAADRVARRIDPDLFLDETARRFTARSMDELAKPRCDTATIVFADIVKFTSISQVVTPDEVMATSRGFFELAVPLLARHRVRPISYLGDALLAIAEGDDHHARGVVFACALVGRVMRVREVRAAVGIPIPNALDGSPLPYRIRSGVATGPVVLGVLGNGFKQEFAAIGRTTNLAARLQGQAEPDEIVAEAGSAQPTEYLELKGFDAQKIPIVRLLGSA